MDDQIRRNRPLPSELLRKEKKERQLQARAADRLLRILGVVSLALPTQTRQRLTRMDLAAIVMTADDVDFGETLGQVRQALKQETE